MLRTGIRRIGRRGALGSYDASDPLKLESMLTDQEKALRDSARKVRKKGKKKKVIKCHCCCIGQS